MAKAYTFATYRVLPGKEAEFIAAWNRLAATLSGLQDPPYWGTLLRSTTDPTLFHSFGPWESASAVMAMRKDPIAQAAFDGIAALCSEMTPGNYELVAHIEVWDEPSS